MGPWRWPLLWCFHATLVRGTVLPGGQHPQEDPPRPAGWSPAPSSSWAPTPEPGASGDPEGSAAAMAFLQTGDAQRLARANCSRGVAAGAAGRGPPPALRAALRAAPEALAHAANFLNMLFQTNDIREASVAEDVEWYQALVRSLAEGHPWVRRAVLALDAHPLAAKPRLVLQATKGDGEILLQDLSAAVPDLGNLSWDHEWFNALKSQRSPLLRKRLLSNDLRSMETPKWQRGDGYVGEPAHVRWSPPFLECRDGRFLPTWAVTLSSAFYGLKPDLSPEFKGVVRVDVELRDVAIDQCASGPGWFADTHRCDLNSTQCVPQESHGFVLGRYQCRCKPGFYSAGGAASDAWAGTAGSAAGADEGSRLACRPCRRGCAACEDDAPCLIQEDRALRAAVLSCQACCMLAIFLSMLVSYHFRRSKRIRASGVVLLETILFGSLLLYFPVFILYFKPSIFRCIVLRWVRMLGFAIVYGTITLKLYRVLKVFLSRTAQRSPYVSSGRVLKMLGLILLLVLWFLAAWTIGMLENVDRNIPLVIRTQTARGLHFSICGHDRWDYMMVTAEMLFLLWGSSLCYATRAVPSAFHEPRYMGIALHNELMVSAAFHVVRFIMVPSLHPDWTLLLFFAHTHGTITMTLALLFIPKFLHAGSPLREEIAAEVYEDELDMRRSGSCLNSSIASAWSEHSLDPDDIREELKKLYAQLEVQKTRRMAANNPHLPKKRSSRRSLGRSIARRLAELPEAAARRSSGAGERLGTPARRGPSAKRLADASLRTRGDGSRRRAAALRKSRSTEGPAREPRGGSPTPNPLGEPVLGRKMTVATASEQSDCESLDAAPLVCKSASAHDLAGHGQPPLPHAAPLHKSLSVVAGARDEALLAASRAAREGWLANQHPSAPASGCPTGQGPPGAADGLRPAGSSPAEGCSQEDASPPGDGRVQKHVTYAPIKSVSVDSSRLPGRVRVVRRTPPPPPVRCQSLGQRAPAGASPEPSEPPTDPPAEEGTPEGTMEEGPGRTSSPAGKGRLLPAASIPAQVCPWELVQDEILSRKQKATEAADSGTPGDAAATPSGLKPPSQKTSLRSLGLAIKAFNRSRGKSVLKGKREGEGSLRKRGSRRERPGLAEMAAVSLGGIGRDTSSKSPEWRRQRPGSEPTARPGHGETVPCQQNNNAGTAWAAAGWGHGGDGAEGDGHSPAPATGDGEKMAEEPSAPREDGDAGRGPGPPLGVHEIPPSDGHQGDEHPHETPAAAGSGKAHVHPRRGAEPENHASAAIVRLITPKEGVAGPAKGLEGDSRTIQPQDHAEMETPRAEPIAGSSQPSTAGVRRAAAEEPGAEVCPRGAPGVPAARGALLRQEAMASREDTEVPLGWESPAKVLEKGGSQPEPLGPGGSQGSERVPARSRSAEVSPAAAGKAGSAAGRQAELCPGETRADSSIKIEICPWEEGGGPGRALGKDGSERHPGQPGEEPEKLPAKTPELPTAGSAEGRRAEVCPWETGEQGRTVRAEICPWDACGAQAQPERQEGERRRLAKGVRSIGPKSPGLLRAQESGSSLQAAGRHWGSASSEEPPPKPAPRSSELPEVTSRIPTSARASVCPWEAVGADSDAEVCPWERGTASSDAGKIDDGEISQEKNRTSPQGAAPRGTGEPAPAADEGSGQQGSPSPREGAEQPSTGLAAKHPALPKTSSKQGGSIDSKKADICPWQVEDEPLPKTEICPWEEPAAPTGKETLSQDVRGTSKGENKPGSRGLGDIKTKLAEKRGRQPECRDTRIFAKLIRKSLESSKAESKKLKSVESIKEEVCPWESLGTEQPPEKPHTGSSALPKLPSKKSQSVESLKAEVCPWEAQELQPTDKAEICPWEVAAPTSSQEKSREDKDGLSTVSKSPSAGQGLRKDLGDTLSAKEEKGSQDHESICPWESTDMEQPPAKARARSPALPKSPSKKSQSVESLKAEVCPWEAQELQPTDKAEICPWEVAAPTSSQEKSREDKDGLPIVRKSPSTGQGLRKDIGDIVSAKEEKGSRDCESICPWESTDIEHPLEKPCTGSPALPKSPSKKSQSVESLKAEVCPWEAQELQPTDKAEICPWEVAAPPSSQDESREDKHGLSTVSKILSTRQGLRKEIGDSASAKKERGSRDRESICPWESTDTEQPPAKSHAGSPALPKAFSRTSQSVESLKAEVCPWEAPELQPTDKAEICPWEVAAPTSNKEKLREDKDALSTVRKSPSTGQGLCKDIGDTLSAKEEKGSRDCESICPWESTDTEQPPAKARARSPALPKSPSKKSQSVESLKAEVCPWELEPLDKAAICPWEVAAAPSDQPKAKQSPGGALRGDKRITRQAALASPGRSLEKGSSEREAVCPWESLGTEQPPEKPRARSPALPKSPSKKSQSVESLKAEVCPWEAPELQPTDKAEICPWEVAAPPSSQEKSREDKDGLSTVSKILSTGQGLCKEIGDGVSAKKERGGRDRESICPWETLGMEQPPEKPRTGSPALPQSLSKKSQSVESLKAEVCPWEAQELQPTDKAEICPWEVAAPTSGQEKSREDKDGLSIMSKSPSTGQGLRKDIGDTISAKQERGSRDRESICPWESTDTEHPLEKPCTGSPALPKSPSKKSQSVESLKAEVCPWEAQELQPTEKAEICPWEVAAPPSSQEKSREDKHGLSTVSKNLSTGQGLRKEIGDSASAKKERGSRDRESICPWESTDTEQPPAKSHAGSPALPKAFSRTSQSVESLKAEVCPWEAPELQPTDKAEICPWEVAAPTSNKEKLRENKDALSTVRKSPSTGRGLCKDIGDTMSAKEEKGSRDRESICPWESTDTEQPPAKARARSPALPQSLSQKSQSVESLKAEVCPWELQPLDKAAICPWEVAAAPSDQPKAKQGPGGASKGDKRITRQAALASPGRSLEKGSSEREAVCPWESLGTEQPPEKPRARSPAAPKSPSKKSQSVESLKAEVCPWEAQELQPTDKAEICPWEVAAPPSSQEKSREDKDGLSTVSKILSTAQGLCKDIGDSTSAKKERAGRDCESICPWESMDTEHPPEEPCTGSPALPKSPSKKSQSVESLKAEVCPWEAQELQPTDKAEICPWEVAAPPSSQEKSREDKDGLSTVSKILSTGQGLCKEIGDGVSAKKERGGRDRESICPWESTDTEHPPEEPCTGSPALPKSPSKKSQSVESLKAEVCPWEAQELQPTDKAEICPWEVAAPPSSQDESREGKDGLSTVSKSPSTAQGLCKDIGDSMSAKQERGGRDRESICPWESLGMEQPPEIPRTGSPALPQSPSKKSQSVESLKAEVCPWEAPELQPTDKAEICPWEVAAALPEKGAALGEASIPLKKAGASTAPEKRSSKREAICPWETLVTEEPSLNTAMGKELRKKSDSTDSRKPDICPWEAAEPTSLEKKSCEPGVCPQGADRAAPTGMGMSEPVAGASTVPPTSLLKKSKGRSDGKAEHKPLCRILPGIQPLQGPGAEPLRQGASTAPAAGSSPSPGVSVAEVCPWEAEEGPPAPDKTSADPRKTSEVCPWEVESVGPTLHGQGRASASPRDGGKAVSETRPNIRPWDHE
ncbi:LOW QUALITY PROTEIN: putative G-protein coupled receptor 179 [Opisthocomus hoazin]|uniref:LOW QUALITY PROTEIN: putative G-protein coupled receptor 179 n=1 Tax=Opisthocomus hoazin TaxID=30419 RepID=UPI003F5334BC